MQTVFGLSYRLGNSLHMSSNDTTLARGEVPEPRWRVGRLHGHPGDDPFPARGAGQMVEDDADADQRAQR